MTVRMILCPNLNMMTTVNPSAQECFSKSFNSVVTMRAEDIVYTKAILGIPLTSM